MKCPKCGRNMSEYSQKNWGMCNGCHDKGGKKMTSANKCCFDTGSNCEQVRNLNNRYILKDKVLSAINKLKKACYCYDGKVDEYDSETILLHNLIDKYLIEELNLSPSPADKGGQE